MPTRTHDLRVVHRPLHLTSPLATGPDVRALQNAVKDGLEHYEVDWLPVSVDGRLGRQTLHAARFYAWIIGLGNGHRSKLTVGIVPEATQRLLRGDTKRSILDLHRESRRRGKLRRIRKAQHEGPKAAVAYARKFVGVTESPAESNSGPTVVREGTKGGITLWENYWGLGVCFWCLCFACYCVRAIGKAAIDGLAGDSNPVNAEVIERMAREHAHGWVLVSASEARAGDIALFDFDGDGIPEHGELVVGPFAHGLTDDIGGNTSSGDGGSQSNGGGVFPRKRPLSQLTAVARPLYR